MTLTTPRSIPATDETTDTERLLEACKHLQHYHDLLIGGHPAPEFPKRSAGRVYVVQDKQIETNGDDTPETIVPWDSEQSLCCVTASPEAAVYHAVRHLMLPLLAGQSRTQSRTQTAFLHFFPYGDNDQVLIIQTSSPHHDEHIINGAEAQIMITEKELL